MRLFGRISQRTCNDYPGGFERPCFSCCGVYRIFSGHGSYAGLGAAYTPCIVEEGETYRIFTSMFLHFGIEHLINNMLVLFVLGSRLERVIGSLRFAVIYFLGGIAGNVVSLLYDLKQGETAVSAGASGAVFAVMGGMILVVLCNKGRLEDLSMRQILVLAVFSLYFGFTSSGVDNAAHLGGFLAGFILAVIVYHPRRKT